MATQPNSRLRVRIVILATVTAVVATWLLTREPWGESLLLEHWRVQIVTGSDEAAAQAVRQAAELGPASLPLLVESVGSYRHSVALAAQQGLLAQLAKLEQAELPVRSARLATLGQALSDAVDTYGPEGKRLASDVAERILRMETDPTVADRFALVANCRKVLFSTTLQRLRPQAIAAATALGRTDRDDAAQAAARGTVAEAFQSTPPLPGGGLEILSLPVPSLPERVARQTVEQDQAATEPEQFPLQPVIVDRPRGVRPGHFRRPPQTARLAPAGSSVR